MNASRKLVTAQDGTEYTLTATGPAEGLSRRPTVTIFGALHDLFNKSLRLLTSGFVVYYDVRRTS
jgi:hypothetical protein